MEKDQDDRPNALVRQFSEGWSVQEAPESPGPSEDPLDFGKENQDIEKDGGNEDLSRVVSGPPYTIFGPRAKMFIVLSVSVSSLISPFGATTFYPALNVLAHQLHVTPTLMNLSLTTYMVSRPLYRIRVKEKAGLTLIRLHKLLHLRSLLALPTLVDADYRSSYASLSILPPISAWRFRRTMPRCWSFESSKLLVCSAAIALANAVVADIATSQERGRYMGYATAGLLFGPSFGPTIGGVLAQYLGWRSIFWFLVIFTSILLLIFVIFFPETCRNVVGNGSIPAKGVSQSVLGYVQQRRHARGDQSIHDDASIVLQKERKFNFPNPLLTLKILGEKESCIILLYNGFFFTGMMVAVASVPDLYQNAYGLNELELGLCYISLGIGSFVSALTMGHVVDWNFRYVFCPVDALQGDADRFEFLRRHARRLGITIRKGKQQDLENFPIEVVRFQVVLPGHVIGTLALIAYGWTIKFRTHIAGPEVALFFIGFGVSTSFNLTNTLLIDLHREKPATATAAVNLVRCLLSASGAAVIIPMCHAMNPGWAFNLHCLYICHLHCSRLLAHEERPAMESRDNRKEKTEGRAGCCRCRS